MVSMDNGTSALLEQTEHCSPSVPEDLLSTCIPSRAILWCTVQSGSARHCPGVNLGDVRRQVFLIPSAYF